MALTSFMNNAYERKPQKIGESNEQISAIDVGQETKADATDSYSQFHHHFTDKFLI